MEGKGEKAVERADSLRYVAARRPTQLGSHLNDLRLTAGVPLIPSLERWDLAIGARWPTSFSRALL